MNEELIKIFKNIGDLLKIRNDPADRMKPQAYFKAVATLTDTEEDVLKMEDPTALYGIGKGLASKIKEIADTGTCEYYEKLKKEVPVSLLDVLKINNFGPVAVNKLWKEYGIVNTDQLLQKWVNKYLKLTKGQYEGLKAYFETGGVRMQLEEALQIGTPILEYLRQVADKADFGGSLRRRKETIKDIDILACSDNPDELIEHFSKYPGATGFEGKERMFHVFVSGRRIDFLVVPKDEWGAAVNYFTGSKEHNVMLRKIAKKAGIKINEKGYWKVDDQGNEIERLGGETEEEIFELLHLKYVPPEKREGNSEVLNQLGQLELGV